MLFFYFIFMIDLHIFVITGRLTR